VQRQYRTRHATILPGIGSTRIDERQQFCDLSGQRSTTVNARGRRSIGVFRTGDNYTEHDAVRTIMSNMRSVVALDHEARGSAILACRTQGRRSYFFRRLRFEQGFSGLGSLRPPLYLCHAAAAYAGCPLRLVRAISRNA